MSRSHKKSSRKRESITPPPITPPSPEELKELRTALANAHEMHSIHEMECRSMRALLLKRKIDLCLVPIDWHKEETQTILIANKRKILLEILEFYGKRKFKSLDLLKQSFRLLSLNLFRSLPDPNSIRTKDGDDMDFREPSWDHLVLVYEIAFHVVTNTEIDKKTMQLFLRGRFLRQLCNLFQSLDDREPQYVKIILHAIYGRFMGLRKEIRGYLCDFCYQYIYESKCELVDSNQSLVWQGIPEVLAIFCSIIQGLNIPVKKDYHELLRNVLVPLHKTFHVDAFHEELIQCCAQFALKDPSSLSVILGGIIKFWPRTSPLKIQLYIDEIVHLVSNCFSAGHGDFEVVDKGVLGCVVKQLCDCMLCPHHQIAERSLLVWKQEAMIKLLSLDNKFWAMVYSTMTKMSQNYWLVDIRNITKNVMAELQCTNPQFFRRRHLLQNKKKFKKFFVLEKDGKKQKERQGKWERVRELAVQIHV